MKSRSSGQSPTPRHAAPPAIGALLAVLFFVAPGVAPLDAVAQEMQTPQTQPTTLVVTVRDDAGAPLGGREVFVVVSDGQQVTDERTGTSGADGEVRFTDVAVGTGYTARAVTVADGLPYQGERIELTPGGELMIPLTIGAVSDAPAALHIDVLHIVLNRVEPGIYQALQVMSIRNPDQQTAYSETEFNGERVGLVIPLPDAASAVAPLPIEVGGLDPNRLAQDGNRLLDMRPVPPGTRQVAVQYEIITGADGSDIEITVPHPTRQVSMLLGPGLGTDGIDSEQLSALDPVTIEGQGQYANYTSDVLAAGDTLRFRLGPQSAGLTVASWSLLALAAALLASAAASIFFAQPPAPDPARRQQLIAGIARLDEQHAAGGIDTAAYHAQRAAALDGLLELDDRSGAGAAAGE